MSVIVSISVVQPKNKRLANPAAYRRSVNTLLKNTGKAFEKDMREPTQYWNKSIPIKHKQEVNYVEVTTNDPRWYYLNVGTNIRWAVLTPDFIPKTTPRQLHGRPGQGQVLIAGKLAMLARGLPPRPGIKARQWIDIIVQKEGPIFKQKYREILNKDGIFWN